MIPTVTFFPLLFPTGRPLTPRWRPVVWMAGVTLILVLIDRVVPSGPIAGVLRRQPVRSRLRGRGVRDRQRRDLGDDDLRGHDVDRDPLPPIPRGRAAADQVGGIGSTDVRAAVRPVRRAPGPAGRRRPRIRDPPVGPAAHRIRRRPGGAALSALRHRRRHQPGARLRLADRHARRRLPGQRAAPAGRAREVSPAVPAWRSPPRPSAPPPSSGPRDPRPGSRRPPLLPAASTTPLRRSSDSAPGCATKSTSTRSPPSCAPSSPTPCSPSTSRSGLGSGPHESAHASLGGARHQHTPLCRRRSRRPQHPRQRGRLHLVGELVPDPGAGVLGGRRPHRVAPAGRPDRPVARRHRPALLDGRLLQLGLRVGL